LGPRLIGCPQSPNFIKSLIRLQADGGGNFSDYSESTKMNKADGWWKFAPNWELMAGYNDNTAALQVGWDWVAASGPTKSFGPSNVNNEQMRLTIRMGRCPSRSLWNILMV